MRPVSRPATDGFTLVELLIVIVIVGILTMVAIPTYRTSVMKARRADGKVTLNDTAQRLERCYTQFGAYNAADCGIDDGDDIASQEGFYTVTVAIADATTYTLTAAPEGDQVNDDACTSLRLDNAGLHTATGADPTHCW